MARITIKTLQQQSKPVRSENKLSTLSGWDNGFVSGNTLRVQEKSKDTRWTDSMTVSRQGTGVFLGGNAKDIQDDNPFKSEKQRRFMWSQHPKIAKRWAHEKKGGK